MEPLGSYEQTIGERMRGRVFFFIVLTMLITLSVLVFALALASPHPSKYLASFGLVLDMSGVLLASYPIFFPPQKEAAPGVQFLSNIPRIRAQVLAEYAERHGFKMQIGGGLIALGFLMQLLSNWT